MNDEYLTKLNKDQLIIINDNSFLNSKSAMCIIACAGSGKTTTIIAKIVDMIKKFNCNPSEFFITTFTRNAACELKSRLKEYLTEQEIYKMTIGTFHSIAYQNVNNSLQSKHLIEDHIEKYLYDYELLLDNNDYKEEHRHKYIFIDEYQDINLIQERIIRKLYDDALLLVTVGDDVTILISVSCSKLPLPVVGNEGSTLIVGPLLAI
jgi:superfamily I DNA/RNA helicase